MAFQDKFRAFQFGLPLGVPACELAGEKVLLLHCAPLELSEADLSVEKLFSEGARKSLLSRPGGPTTEDGLRYAMYMATEFMYQQLLGNNAANETITLLAGNPEIGSGQNRDHARYGPGGRRVDALDAGMGMHGAHERGLRHAGKPDVVEITAAPGNQLANKRLPRLLISISAHSGTASRLAGVLTGVTI